VEGRNITEELNNLFEASHFSANVTLTPLADATEASPIELPPVDHNCGGNVTSVFVTASNKDEYGFVGVAASPNGKFVYGATYSSDELVVLDVSSNSSHASVVGSVSLGNLNGGFVAVSPSGLFAFVTLDNSDSMVVVNVQDPTAPLVVSVLKNSTCTKRPQGVAVSSDGQFVFVVGWDSHSLAVIDVGTDPTHPTVLGSIVGDSSNMYRASAVTVSGDGGVVYVGGEASLTVVDVSRPTNPVVVSSVSGNSTLLWGVNGLGVSKSNGLVFAAGSWSKSLTVVNVSDPLKPVLVGNVADDLFSGARGIALSSDGNFVFIGCYSTYSLAVVDVGTSSSKPVLVSSAVFDSSNMKGVFSVAASPNGTRAYLSGADSGNFAIVSVC